MDVDRDGQTIQIEWMKCCGRRLSGIN